MGKEDRNLTGRFESRAALVDWLWAKTKLAFPALAASSPGGGIMAYLAYVTEWLDEWGPIAWGLAFAIGMLATLWGMAGWAHFADKRSRAKANELISTKTFSINPLDTDFIGLKIDLNEFYSPFGEVNANKTFRKCKFYGPGNILLIPGINFDRNNVNDMQHVCGKK